MRNLKQLLMVAKKKMPKILLAFLSLFTLLDCALAVAQEETDNPSQGFTIQHPHVVDERTCAATLVKKTSAGTRSYRAILLDHKGESRERCESAKTSSDIVVIGEWADFSEASHLLEAIDKCVKSLVCIELSESDLKIAANALKGRTIRSIDYSYNSTKPWNFIACDDLKASGSDKCVALNFSVKDGHFHGMRVLEIAH
jgi:hypothetical protein